MTEIDYSNTQLSGRKLAMYKTHEIMREVHAQYLKRKELRHVHFVGGMI